MSSEDFNKIHQDEYKKYEWLCIYIPAAILIACLFLLKYDKSDYLPLRLYLIPLVYVPIFFIIYVRKFYQFKYNPSAKNYFKNLGYDRAIIRYFYLNKLFKNSIIILIIAGLFVTITIAFTLKSIYDTYDLYNSNEKKYQNELVKTLYMNPGELKAYYRNATINMNQNEIERNLLDIAKLNITRNDQIYGENYSMLSQNMLSLESNKIKNMDEIQQRELLKQRIDTIPFDDLQKIVISNIALLKPSNSDIGAYNYSQTIEVLIMIVVLFGVMTYTVYLTKYSLTRKKDFHYNYAIGCVTISSGHLILPEMGKRKYLKAALSHYDKFIRDNLNMRIKNLDEVYSKILICDSKSLVELSREIKDNLSTQHELKLLEFLKPTPDMKNSEILVTVSSLTKFKESFTIIFSFISTIIAIVTSIAKLYQSV